MLVGADIVASFETVHPKDRQVVSCDDSADDGQGNAHAIGLFAEAVEFVFRNRAENFVIVPAGQGQVEEVGRGLNGSGRRGARAAPGRPRPRP